MSHYAVEVSDGRVSCFSQDGKATMSVYAHTKKIFNETPGACSFLLIENLFKVTVVDKKL
jgi:hypothetical protein